MSSLRLKYSEEEFVSLLKEGDEQAFSVLFDNYQRALSGVISGIIEDVDTVEDILQEVFVKIWNSRMMYDVSKGRLYTWMLNIARNSSIDHLRSKRNKFDEKIHRSANSVHQMDRANNVETAIDHIGLKKIVDQLKEEQRILIDMAYFRGYTQEEIAEELNLPLGTVKTRVRAALIVLRKLVQ